MSAETNAEKQKVSCSSKLNVLRTIREHGPISRTDIATLAGISRAPLTDIIQELLNEKNIVIVGDDNTSGIAPRGRRKVLLDLNQSARFYMGVFIGKTLLSIGITTLRGECIGKANVTLHSNRTVLSMLGTISSLISKLLKDNCLTCSNIVCVGVGVEPCMFDSVGGSDFHRLKEALEVITNSDVYIDNAVSLRALRAIGDSTEGLDTSYKSAVLQCSENSMNAVYIDDSCMMSTEPYILHNITNEIIRDAGKRKKITVKSLTPGGIAEELFGTYCREITPHLYRQTEGKLRLTSIAEVMTAADRGDIAVRKMRDTLVKDFCTLLVSILKRSEVHIICLCDFNFKAEQLDEISAEVVRQGVLQYKNRIIQYKEQPCHEYKCGISYAELMSWQKDNVWEKSIM